jgi:hypothetical protein
VQGRAELEQQLGARFGARHELERVDHNDPICVNLWTKPAATVTLRTGLGLD